MLEHIEDPIAALENLVRVTRPKGVVFLTLPDQRYTFDAARTPTAVDHLLRDHEQGPAQSRQAHYEEWALLIERLPEDRVKARAEEFARSDGRHHFHVWRLSDFLELLAALQLDAELVHAQSYLGEFAVVLRRCASGDP